MYGAGGPCRPSGALFKAVSRIEHGFPGLLRCRGNMAAFHASYGFPAATRQANPDRIAGSEFLINFNYLEKKAWLLNVPCRLSNPMP
jgi:hypothetical protein